MSFKEPTFEEYQKATAWAKFKFKYGFVVMILCWVCLLFIIYYMLINGEAISSNPLVYGAEKLDVECYCYNHEGIGKGIEFYFNGTTLWETKG